jgi:hypothetical protein
MRLAAEQTNSPLENVDVIKLIPNWADRHWDQKNKNPFLKEGSECNVGTRR